MAAGTGRSPQRIFVRCKANTGLWISIGGKLLFRRLRKQIREAAFIKQNKEKWLEFEKSLYSSGEKKPERLADLFIQINNDLAYAQTYYPKSNVIRYLNGLATTAYHKIYGQRKSKKGLAGFWAYEVPMIMFQYRKYFYFSFALFFLMIIIGVFFIHL